MLSYWPPCMNVRFPAHSFKTAVLGRGTSAKNFIFQETECDTKVICGPTSTEFCWPIKDFIHPDFVVLQRQFFLLLLASEITSLGALFFRQIKSARHNPSKLAYRGLRVLRVLVAAAAARGAPQRCRSSASRPLAGVLLTLCRVPSLSIRSQSSQLTPRCQRARTPSRPPAPPARVCSCASCRAS